MTSIPVQLLCIAGTSPAVVTETVYVLAVRGEGDVGPQTIEHVHIITTTGGRTSLEAVDLIRCFRSMARDYPDAAARIPVRDDQIVIEVPNDTCGVELNDVRDACQSAVMADAIVDAVRRLTANDDRQLHASLAGGRKTMGHFLGSAMMLFARPMDMLSHILAGANAEACRQFFYPPSVPTMMEASGGVQFDASLESVELYSVPLLRLRDHVVNATRGQAKVRLPGSYAELVDVAQQVLTGSIRVSVDIDTATIRINDQKLRLQPGEAAILSCLLVEHAQGRTPVPATDMLYRNVGVGPALYGLHRNAQVTDEQSKDPFFYDELPDNLPSAARKKDEKRVLIDNLAPQISTIRKVLKAQLVSHVATLLTPNNVGPKGHRAYTVELDPTAIEVIEDSAYPERVPVPEQA
ncbi:MAG: TIGR02584 family CRISPR-associated protein [Bradymonadaceae bacterium]|nr:TIGR02584 family CRISPR-associated protein [Lujinxingiaceae bacterium]